MTLTILEERVPAQADLQKLAPDAKFWRIAPALSTERIRGITTHLAPSVLRPDRADKFVIYPTSDGSYRDLGSARMRAEFGGGGVADVPAQTWGSGAEVVGAVDVDGDGRDEIIVDPHGGATAHGVGLAVVQDCRPHEVTAADGTVFELLYYQNSLCCVGEAVGVDCVDVTGDSAVELVATYNAPSGEWSYVAYTLDGDHAFEAAQARGRGPTGKPAHIRFSWGLECRGYHYPDWSD